MNVLAYWFYIGTFYLIRLTWQDYKNNMLVDDRRNAVMLGLSLSIVSHVPTTLVYKLALGFTLVGLNMFLKKAQATGEADVNTLSWLLLGLGLIHISFLIVFLAVFTAVTLIWFILKKIIKNEGKTQFYGVILLSFIISSWLLGGYV
jgi:hypothetical protein